ncbi:MAG: hypothetical protein MK439_03195, partial [SAR324 cluster bacterium]|nr:hypothetical protein [SAR324 cluster bacterium]
RLPYACFLQHEDFHSLQYASHPCHSARSRRQSRRIHPPRKYPFTGCVEGSSSKNPLPLGEGGLLTVGHGEDTIKGIFPKRPEKM